VHSIGKEIGVDPDVILQTSHGRRSIDILKIVSPDKANWECKSTLRHKIMFFQFYILFLIMRCLNLFWELSSFSALRFNIFAFSGGLCTYIVMTAGGADA
jgi:hypothetical protein